MSDTLLLGGVCVGLGLYCLHLRSECNKLYTAGQYVTRLLCMEIEGKDSPELDMVRQRIKDAKEQANG